MSLARSIATRLAAPLSGARLPDVVPEIVYTLASRPLAADVPEGTTLRVSGLPVGNHQRRVHGNWVTVGRDVIIDTDWWTDSDDAVAMRVAVQLERLGHINIKGFALCTTDDIGPGSLDAFLIADGRTNNRIAAPLTPHTPTHGNGLFQPRLFAMPHVAGKPSELPQNAVQMYRDILSKAPGKVDLIVIGFYNNLAELLDSGPDQFSPLSGLELVTQKVNLVYGMGGAWPTSSAANMPGSTAEYNFGRTPQAIAAAQKVISTWPTPILLSGYEVGYNIFTGSNLEGLVGSDHLANALNDHGDFPATGTKGRPSWDPLKVLLGGVGFDGSGNIVKAIGPHGYSVVRGTAAVNASGENTFTANGTGKHYYTVKLLSTSEFRANIDSMLLPSAPPAKAPLVASPTLPLPLSPNQTAAYVDGQHLVEEWNAADLQLLDGANVDTWPGRKRGFALNPTSTTRAQFFTTGGLPAVLFTNNLLQTIAIKVPREFSVYAVVRWASTPGGNQSIVTQDSGSTSTTRSWHMKSAAGAAVQIASFAGTGATSDTTPAVVTGNEWHHFGSVRREAQIEAFFNGASNGPTACPQGNEVAQPITVGGRGVGAEYLVGYIHSVRLYEGAHDAATAAAIRAEMMQD